jgi:hypothetical protein
MNKTNFVIAVCLSVVSSMLIAYIELGSTFNLGQWALLSVSVLSGPLYPLVMMVYEEVTLTNILFVLFTAALAVIPLVIGWKRNSATLYFVGVSLWVIVGYSMAIAVYI